MTVVLREQAERVLALDAHTEGAVEMARHWLRHPEKMTDAGFPQVCRELYTVSPRPRPPLNQGRGRFGRRGMSERVFDLDGRSFDEEVDRLVRQAWQSNACPDCGRPVMRTPGVDGTVFVFCVGRPDCSFGFFVNEARLSELWRPRLDALASAVSRVVRPGQENT